MFKKLLSGVLAFTLLFTMPTVPAMAQEAEVPQDMESVAVETAQEDATEYTSGSYTYVLKEDGTAKITKYTDSTETTITIPSTLDGYTVSEIGESAFYFSKVLNVTIPGTVKTIGNDAFNYCEVEYVTLEEGVVNILEDAFDNTEINKITIPASVTNIEEAAFDGICDTIEIASANTSYKVVDDVLYTMDGKVLLNCWRTEKEFVIPSTVTRIGSDAFSGRTYVETLTIPDSVVEIGSYAFFNSFVENVTIGTGVTTIEEYAFYSSDVENITIPGNVKTLEAGAFYRAPLRSIVLENGIKSIGANAFSTCKYLETITFPASVKTIGDGVLRECPALKEITVDSENTAYKVTDGALLSIDGKRMIAYPCARMVESYKVPDGVEEIAKYIFAECTVLKDIKMPESLKTLGSDAFYNCTSLEAVVLAGNVETLGGSTFNNCTSLKRIYIPSSVKRISQAAFYNCNALETVYYVGSEANWEDIAIVNSGNSALTNATIYYMANLRLFVERMYTVALGRDADSAGLNNWVQMLVEETHDGAGLAKEFILGEEFALRNLSNEEYVDVLYATFFDREADTEGKNLWVAVLEAGQSREYVLSNFVNLGEFTQLCAEFEINRGVMFEDGEVATKGMIQFVQRLYTLVLGREADDEGLKSWTTALHNKTLGAQNVAAKFFNSTEYELKAADTEAYVTDLYGVFMNRDADAEGLAFWVSCIEEHGMNRNWVLSEFANSEEFKAIAAAYGL